MKLNFMLLVFCGCLFFACIQDTEKDEVIDPSCYPNSERPTNAITYQEMANMFEQYDSHQKKVLDESLGKEETVSIFYTLDELKQYIAYVERLSQEKEIPLTGIRIFSAAYPADYSVREYQKRQTLIFSPTTTINGKEGVAFEPLYSEKGTPISMKDFLDKYTNETTRDVNRAGIIPSLFEVSNLPPNMDSSSANRGHPYPGSGD